LIQPVRISSAAGESGLAELGAPLPLASLVPGDGDWEVEIGFGKGRYLLRRSAEEPGRRFLGIELATEYYRMMVERARRRSLTNWVALRGEALLLLSAVLPAGFAAAVHVYFPDPWPKSRHHKRRLFEPETVDLVLGLLRPGGSLFFATRPPVGRGAAHQLRGQISGRREADPASSRTARRPRRPPSVRRLRRSGRSLT